MDFLPQVSSEDLDEGNLQGGDFTMHEDASQIQLHLETHVNLHVEQELLTNTSTFPIHQRHHDSQSSKRFFHKTQNSSLRSSLLFRFSFIISNKCILFFLYVIHFN
jgi:hypothetical protein